MPPGFLFGTGCWPRPPAPAGCVRPAEAKNAADHVGGACTVWVLFLYSVVVVLWLSVAGGMLAVGTPWGLRVPAGAELPGLAWSCLLFSWPMDMQDGCVIELPEDCRMFCSAACTGCVSSRAHQLRMCP